MKKILITSLIILATTSAYAFDLSKFYHKELSSCPKSSEQLLEVTKFLPSANSNYSKGICFVKANTYFWYDLIGDSITPYEVEVDADICDSHNFVNVQGQQLIKATVSYKGHVSMCGSKPGCHYECKPIVEFSHF